MIKFLLKYFGLFVLLVLLQEFFFSNIQLSGFINPYVYVLFVLMLPMKTPRWILLTTAFLLGLSVDLFADTLGFHTFATTLIAFVRPDVINFFTNRRFRQRLCSHNGCLWLAVVSSLRRSNDFDSSLCPVLYGGIYVSWFFLYHV